MNNRVLVYKNSFSKWLFAAVLLLSFFAFSANPSQSRSTQNLLQNEAAYITRSQAIKTISYNRALNQIQSKHHILPLFTPAAIDTAYFHNLAAKTGLVSYRDKNIGRLQNQSICEQILYLHKQNSEPAIPLV